MFATTVSKAITVLTLIVGQDPTFGLVVPGPRACIDYHRVCGSTECQTQHSSIQSRG